MSSDINFKHVHGYFSNISILTNSTTPGEVQVNLCRATIGNKSLGRTITVFSLMLSNEFLAVVSVNTKNSFDISGIKIRLPITEGLLCVTTVDLAQYKNLCNWVILSAVLLLPFLTKSVVL